jgi:hypothetical protein
MGKPLRHNPNLLELRTNLERNVTSRPVLLGERSTLDGLGPYVTIWRIPAPTTPIVRRPCLGDSKPVR